MNICTTIILHQHEYDSSSKNSWKSEVGLIICLYLVFLELWENIGDM